VHIFYRMRKEAILLLHIQENTWQIIVKHSQLYLKQSKSIPKELRYQEKIHAVICYAKRKEKKNPANSPNFFFFFFFFKKEKKK
jgi:hypothetical protein